MASVREEVEEEVEEVKEDMLSHTHGMGLHRSLPPLTSLFHSKAPLTSTYLRFVYSVLKLLGCVGIGGLGRSL